MVQQSSPIKKVVCSALSLAPIALLGSASLFMVTASHSRADAQSYNTSTYENLNYANPTKWERPSSADTAAANSESLNTTTYENLNYANPSSWERPSSADTAAANSESLNTTTYENLNYANPSKWERPSQVN